MDNNNPTLSITEQFDVVFDKAIAEIKQEESALEAQIRELTEQKTALTKRREQLTNLRGQVEDLTEGIRAADEQYEAEIKKKEELDAEIEQTVNTLAHLKGNRQEVETRVESAENEKRAKHEQLAQMRAQLGAGVNIDGADEVVTNLERTVIDTRVPEFPASVVVPEPAIEDSSVTDEEPIVANEASAPAANLTADHAENEAEEEGLEQPERIPEVINIATDLEAEELAREDASSEDAGDAIAAFTVQPQTLVDGRGEVKQPPDPDDSDDQMPEGAIDVDFDELTHDEAEDDEASEDGLVRISEVEVSLSPIGSNDPQTDDGSSETDDAVDVDFDELVPAEESEEKQTEAETPRKRGNVFTRSWKPRS